MPVTAYVTREPDRSGNFVCDGVADNVQIQAAITAARASKALTMFWIAPINVPDDVPVNGETVLKHCAEAIIGIANSPMASAVIIVFLSISFTSLSFILVNLLAL